MRHYIYTGPTLEDDWVYGGPIREGETPLSWPSTKVVIFTDKPGQPAWEQALQAKDRYNEARRRARQFGEQFMEAFDQALEEQSRSKEIKVPWIRTNAATYWLMLGVSVILGIVAVLDYLEIW